MSISAQPNKAADEREGVALDNSSQRGTLLWRLGTLKSLRRAFEKIARNRKSAGGIDDVSVADFSAEKEGRLRAISHLLRNGSYHFSPLRPVAVPKKGRNEFRPILIPTVADRVVQRAILHEISRHIAPLIEHRTSHAFRRDFGVKSAVFQLAGELKKGKRVVLIVDIENFFGAINAERLFDELLLVLPDRSLAPLLIQLQNWEMNDLSSLPVYKHGCFPQQGKGVPQGSALSPVLSNFYLRELDAQTSAKGVSAVRYADDIAIACESRAEAQSVFDWVAQSLQSRGLTIHPIGHKKSHITEIGLTGVTGVEYLGFFLVPKLTGVAISISRASFAKAKNAVDDCFDPRHSTTLAERYTRLTYFLNSWLGTFGYVCDTHEERAQLLESAQRGLTRLLVSKELLPKSAGLTKAQRAFLGIDSIFDSVARKHRAEAASRRETKRAKQRN